VALFVKDFGADGLYSSPDGKIRLTVPFKESIVRQFHRAKKNGILVPVAWGHTPAYANDEDDVEYWQNKYVAGFVDDLKVLRNGLLRGVFDIPRDEDASRIGKTVRGVSGVFIREFEDGLDRVYSPFMIQVGLVTYPVEPAQDNFRVLDESGQQVEILGEKRPRVKEFPAAIAMGLRRADFSGGLKPYKGVAMSSHGNKNNGKKRSMAGLDDYKKRAGGEHGVDSVAAKEGAKKAAAADQPVNPNMDSRVQREVPNPEYRRNRKQAYDPKRKLTPATLRRPWGRARELMDDDSHLSAEERNAGRGARATIGDQRRGQKIKRFNDFTKRGGVKLPKAKRSMAAGPNDFGVAGKTGSDRKRKLQSLINDDHYRTEIGDLDAEDAAYDKHFDGARRRGVNSHTADKVAQDAADAAVKKRKENRTMMTKKTRKMAIEDSVDDDIEDEDLLDEAEVEADEPIDGDDFETDEPSDGDDLETDSIGDDFDELDDDFETDDFDELEDDTADYDEEEIVDDAFQEGPDEGDESSANTSGSDRNTRAMTKARQAARDLKIVIDDDISDPVEMLEHFVSAARTKFISDGGDTAGGDLGTSGNSEDSSGLFDSAEEDDLSDFNFDFGGGGPDDAEEDDETEMQPQLSGGSVGMGLRNVGGVPAEVTAVVKADSERLRKKRIELATRFFQEGRCDKQTTEEIVSELLNPHFRMSRDPRTGRVRETSIDQRLRTISRTPQGTFGDYVRDDDEVGDETEEQEQNLGKHSVRMGLSREKKGPNKAEVSKVVANNLRYLGIAPVSRG